ncbi:hypothetical protein [Pseudomonas fluorescens]|uniref:hypothetical protein n=1 Tax=Pseudomonas fluorescens TaxID=294 RepID=UPI001781C238|nr:hypothetical protein [Pseudomonas fluorescens]
MNEAELLNRITANLPGLRCELTLPEFYFEIGMDGSSFMVEIEIARTLRSNSFRQKLRACGIDFLFYRNGKIEFVEVAHVE